MTTQVGETISIPIDPESNIYGRDVAAALVTARREAEDETGVVHELVTVREFGQYPTEDRVHEIDTADLPASTSAGADRPAPGSPEHFATNAQLDELAAQLRAEFASSAPAPTTDPAGTPAGSTSTSDRPTPGDGSGGAPSPSGS